MKFCPQCTTELTLREVDQFERMACPAKNCDFIFWNNPTPVVAAIVEWKGDIILARNVSWPEGMFGLITGFLEAGEDPEQGVIREVKEELGLESTQASFIGNYIFPQANQLIIAYHILAEGRIFRGEELAELKAVKPEDLKPWDIGTGPAVKAWLASYHAAKNK